MTMQERNEQMEKVAELYRQCQNIESDFNQAKMRLGQVFSYVLNTYIRLDTHANSKNATQEAKDRLDAYAKNSFYPAKDMYRHTVDMSTEVYGAILMLSACMRTCDLDIELPLIESSMKNSLETNKKLTATIETMQKLC